MNQDENDRRKAIQNEETDLFTESENSRNREIDRQRSKDYKLPTLPLLIACLSTGKKHIGGFFCGAMMPSFHGDNGGDDLYHSSPSQQHPVNWFHAGFDRPGKGGFRFRLRAMGHVESSITDDEAEDAKRSNFGLILWHRAEAKPVEFHAHQIKNLATLLQFWQFAKWWVQNAYYDVLIQQIVRTIATLNSQMPNWKTEDTSGEPNKNNPNQDFIANSRA